MENSLEGISSLAINGQSGKYLWKAIYWWMHSFIFYFLWKLEELFSVISVSSVTQFGWKTTTKNYLSVFLKSVYVWIIYIKCPPLVASSPHSPFNPNHLKLSKESDLIICLSSVAPCPFLFFAFLSALMTGRVSIFDEWQWREFMQIKQTGQVGELGRVGNISRLGKSCDKRSQLKEDAQKAELCNGRNWVFRSKDLWNRALAQNTLCVTELFKSPTCSFLISKTEKIF